MRILENRGNWYKGNLHMHTTLSDGALDPVEAINIYRGRTVTTSLPSPITERSGISGKTTVS